MRRLTAVSSSLVVSLAVLQTPATAEGKKGAPPSDAAAAGKIASSCLAGTRPAEPKDGAAKGDRWSERNPAYEDDRLAVSFLLTAPPGAGGDDHQKIKFAVTTAPQGGQAVGLSWSATSDRGSVHSQNTALGMVAAGGTAESQVYAPFGEDECIVSLTVLAVVACPSAASGRGGAVWPNCTAPAAKAVSPASPAVKAAPPAPPVVVDPYNPVGVQFVPGMEPKVLRHHEP